MDLYADRPNWQQVARLAAEALDLAAAPGVRKADINLVAIAVFGLIARADLATRTRPAAQAEPQDAGVEAANEMYREIRGGR